MNVLRLHSLDVSGRKICVVNVPDYLLLNRIFHDDKELINNTLSLREEAYITNMYST